MIKVYIYAKCSTCRNAIQWLDEQDIAYESHPIRDTPPSVKELKHALKHLGDLKKLFNTSGMDYRAMNMKEKLPSLTDDQAIELLSGKGNLVKRPFLISSKVGLVGFKEADWKQALLS